MKSPRISLSVTPRLLEMIEEIQKNKGYPTYVGVIHSAIIELHAKTFPAYMQRLKEETPEEKVSRKEAEKKAKEEFAKRELLEIAQQLEGEVVQDGEYEYCKYYTYAGPHRYEQKVPLRMLSSDLIKTQYQPSKEYVKKLQEDKKVNY